jgi:hypothetical protein
MRSSKKNGQREKTLSCSDYRHPPIKRTRNPHSLEKLPQAPANSSKGSRGRSALCVTMVSSLEKAATFVSIFFLLQQNVGKENSVFSAAADTYKSK